MTSYINKSSYGKSSSTPRRPEGLYHATVTNVDGVDVYVEVPRLTLDFEHGPIPYSGDVPTVGDEVYVGFLEGSQDDVVGIFPGGGGGSGPIEPTYFVASSTARQELKDVADRVDPGVLSEQIGDALLDCNAGGGKVQLGAGTYIVKFPDVGGTRTGIIVYENCTLQGVGDSTIIKFEPQVTGGWQTGISLQRNASLKDLTIDISDWNDNQFYSVSCDDFYGSVDNVTFTGMATSDQEDTYYLFVDWYSRVTNCRFLDIPDDVTVGGCT